VISQAYARDGLGEIVLYVIGEALTCLLKTGPKDKLGLEQK